MHSLAHLTSKQGLSAGYCWVGADTAEWAMRRRCETPLGPRLRNTATDTVNSVCSSRTMHVQEQLNKYTAQVLPYLYVQVVTRSKQKRLDTGENGVWGPTWEGQ